MRSEVLNGCCCLLAMLMEHGLYDYEFRSDLNPRASPSCDTTASNNCCTAPSSAVSASRTNSHASCIAPVDSSLTLSSTWTTRRICVM